MLRKISLASLLCLSAFSTFAGQNAWQDNQNVYRYLKSPSGECKNTKEDCADLQAYSVTQFKKADGFNGIPYGLGSITAIDVNGDGQADDVVKYSGNKATYTAKHAPTAVKHGNYSYFVYSGEVILDNYSQANKKIGTTAAGGCQITTTEKFRISTGKSPALGIYVARYNHSTGKVSEPVLVHMKCTDDPHDNAVVNVDEAGYVYVLVSGRGPWRGNFIFRSTAANSIESFVDYTPLMDDYTGHFKSLIAAAGQSYPISGAHYRGINYPKMYWIDDPAYSKKGYFRLIYTIYCNEGETLTCKGTRQLYSAKMVVDGSKASIEDITPIAAYKGHYAIAKARGKDVVVAFNVHPGNNLDDRTNLYYMHSVDGGETWLNAGNQSVALPIVTPAGLKTVAAREYYDPASIGGIQRRIYMKDVDFMGSGLSKKPSILYVGSLSGDHNPSITADHYLAKARWTGTSWSNVRLANQVDHNYSSGMLHPNGSNYRVFYPDTIEWKNNAMAGGAAAYLDTAGTSSSVWGRTLISNDVLDPKTAPQSYLYDLCEYNYFKSVLNGSNDFVGIFSGGNMYQYREGAPIFMVDLAGNIKRLPRTISYVDANGEVSLENSQSCHN